MRPPFAARMQHRAARKDLKTPSPLLLLLLLLKASGSAAGGNADASLSTANLPPRTPNLSACQAKAAKLDKDPCGMLGVR